MVKKTIDGFKESEKLLIDEADIKRASFVLGEAMKGENLKLLEKEWQGKTEEARDRILKVAKTKVDQLRAWSEKETFVIGGVNRLKRYLDAFAGYCQGSGLSEAEGSFLQIEMVPECQTLMVQDDRGTIGVMHSEEEGGGAFDENHYGYRWVEMKMLDKQVSFMAYPGLCSWGPAFGVNESTNFVQTVDDLYIKDVMDTGAIWANAMAFVTLDIGEIKLAKELVKKLGEERIGKKFVSGYAIHMAQSGNRNEMLSVEFAQDKIKTVEPVKYEDKLIVAQANCPLDKDIQVYSSAVYPRGDRQWSEEDAEIYVEMNNRQRRLMKAGEENIFPGRGPQETIGNGLKILADPRGDIGRYVDKETGKFVYYPSGLPSNVMNSHFVAYLGNREINYWVGKLTPEPIKDEEYQTKIGENYKFGLQRIWEVAERERANYLRENLKIKYPWLFLNRSYRIEILYDFVEVEENEREMVAGMDTMETAKEIFRALQQTGHQVTLIPIKIDTYKEQINELKGEVIFNQVEEDVLGYKVLLYLEELKKVVTGVDSEGFNLSWDKVKVKEILVNAGVATPKFTVSDRKGEIEVNNLKFPLFVKAADDHGSLSITENSLVNNADELKRQVGWVKKEIGGPALVEEYIDGRELGVTVLGNGDKILVLPIKEVLFGKEFDNKAKVITYKSKWDAKSEDWAGTMNMSCPAILSSEEREVVEKAVKKSAKVLKVRDYARFDIRLKDGVPYVIDYNANPALGEKDASGLPVKKFGLTYPEFIQAIVAVALGR